MIDLLHLSQSSQPTRHTLILKSKIEKKCPLELNRAREVVYAQHHAHCPEQE